MSIARQAHELVVRKIGNTHVVTIPVAVVELLSLDTGDLVELFTEQDGAGDVIVIRRKEVGGE